MHSENRAEDLAPDGDERPKVRVSDPSIPEFEQAIQATHGCRSQVLFFQWVVEEFRGEIVWEGEVLTFRLLDHPTATYCYAWTNEMENGERKQYAVLHSPPIDSALKAVQATIVQDAGSRRRKSS